MQHLITKMRPTKNSMIAFIYDFIIFLFANLFSVSQQENVTGHGTYVEYVDSGLYATTAQGQAQM